MPHQSANNRKQTVLIIEDEPGIIDTLVYSLKTEGFEALAAATGSEIRQGRLEGSNGVSAEGAVRLVNVMRQFEMLQKALVLGGEMNRKAVEEVARVGS